MKDKYEALRSNGPIDPQTVAALLRERDNLVDCLVESNINMAKTLRDWYASCDKNKELTVERDALKEVLSQLVRAKDMKEEHGDYPAYRLLKDQAWHTARTLLEETYE